MILPSLTTAKKKLHQLIRETKAPLMRVPCTIFVNFFYACKRETKKKRESKTKKFKTNCVKKCF